MGEIKQIERQLILYDIFRSNDEDTKVSTIMHLLPGINIRTLQRDIRDLMDAGLLFVYYSRDREAYINYGEDIDLSFYSESIQKRIAKKREAMKEVKEVSKRRQEHFKRLSRLIALMCAPDIYNNAIEVYFEMFPDATERMRKRDFEILRHIGFNAGYDKETDAYVLYQKEDYNIYDGYGVYKSKGKMMIY